MSKNLFEVQLNLLKTRFHAHMHRHPALTWPPIEEQLKRYPLILDTLIKMEETGGEPDVAVIQNQILYIDFSKETPKDRRNLCYDEAARTSRKKFPPETSAEALAQSIGIKLLNETLYHHLQELEPLDLKTSSWLDTPEELRKLGGALFGDRRYDRTFIYHNGADSYYGVRGFRGYINLPI